MHSYHQSLHATGDGATPHWSAASACPKIRCASRLTALSMSSNSVVGLARVFNEESLDAGEAHRFLDEVLCQVQDELFDLGSEWRRRRNFSSRACTMSAT